MAIAKSNSPATGTTTGSIIVVSATSGTATLTYIPTGGTAAIQPKDVNGANTVLEGDAHEYSLPTCKWTVTTTGEAIVNRGNHG